MQGLATLLGKISMGLLIIGAAPLIAAVWVVTVIMLLMLGAIVGLGEDECTLPAVAQTPDRRTYRERVE